MKILFMKPNTAWTLIRSNRILVWSHRIVAGSAITQLVILMLAWARFPPLVPLWYSRPWGADQLAPPIFLSVLPCITIVVHMINTVLGMYVTSEYLIFTQTLSLSSILVSVLSLISLIKIIFLVL